MRVALIKGGICLSVILCSQEEADALVAEGRADSWVSRDDISPGDSFDGNTVTKAPPNRITTIRRKAFFRRFTAQEREALENIRATGTTAQKNKLNAFLNYLFMDEHVELDDPYIMATVQLMETAGVIDPGRAAEILSS